MGYDSSWHRFRSLYDYIVDSGMYIPPINDLRFGKLKEYPLDENGEDKLVRFKERYNSNLTFTILTSVLQNTSMLYMGHPGSGKTTTAEIISSAVYDLPLSTVHAASIKGHPELTSEDMLVWFDVFASLKSQKEVIGMREFMKNPVRILDEGNRIPSGKLSNLLEILDRGWVKYKDSKVRSRPGPFYMTMNIADAGSFDLPEALLDRFDIGVIVDYINPWSIDPFMEMKNNKIRSIESRKVEPKHKITNKDLVQSRKHIYYSVKMPQDIKNKLSHFMAELHSCDKGSSNVEGRTKGHTLFKKPGALCRDCKHYESPDNICYTTESSFSPRTISSIYAYSKALSWWRGKREVDEDDVRTVTSYASWFKVRPTRTALERDDRYVNDRIGLMQDLWDTASKTYEKIIEAIPEYKDMTAIYSDYHINNNKPDDARLDDLLSKVKMIDSPSKHMLSAAISNMMD